MLDILEMRDGQDLVLRNSVAPKAANVVSVQLGSLEYANQFGVDLRYYLVNDLRFQNENFQSYLVRKLAENYINVSDVIDTIETFVDRYTFKVSENEEAYNGLIL